MFYKYKFSLVPITSSQMVIKLHEIQHSFYYHCNHQPIAAMNHSIGREQRMRQLRHFLSAPWHCGH